MPSHSLVRHKFQSSLERTRDDLPRVSPILLKWFTWYSRRYLRRHFHTLRISRAGLPPPDLDAPLVIFSNHASWWDPLLWLALKRELFPDRQAFSPIDDGALRRYKILGRLGFFGVERGTRRGAMQFLRAGGRILGDARNVLALTPQGRFADPRERPVRFEAGLGHLAMRIRDAVFLPMASEFGFWEERLPEILVRFGRPVMIGEIIDADSATRVFEQELEAVQDALAAEVKRRQPHDFQTILRGGAGQGGVYDWYRAIMATLRGEPFVREHSTR